MSKPRFYYDKNDAITRCEIIYKNRVFVGEAICHVDDFDFKSETTGCFIAECRAEINKLRHVRNNELKPALQALKHTYGLYVQNKNYNPDSHESKILYKQIQLTNFNLITVNQEIAKLRKTLKDYIDGKEKLYQKIRKAKKR